MVHHLTDGNMNFLSYDTEKMVYTIRELYGVSYETVPPKRLLNTRQALMRNDSYKMAMANGLEPLSVEDKRRKKVRVS